MWFCTRLRYVLGAIARTISPRVRSRATVTHRNDRIFQLLLLLFCCGGARLTHGIAGRSIVIKLLVYLSLLIVIATSTRPRRPLLTVMYGTNKSCTRAAVSATATAGTRTRYRGDFSTQNSLSRSRQELGDFREHLAVRCVRIINSFCASRTDKTRIRRCEPRCTFLYTVRQWFPKKKKNECRLILITFIYVNIIFAFMSKY